MTLFNRVPTVDASAITNRRYGNAIVTSITREITVSIQPRKKPAIEPRIRPEEHRDQRRTDAYLERDLGAVEEPQELVAARGAVGAEDVELALDRAVVLEVVHPRPRPDRQELVR